MTTRTVTFKSIDLGTNLSLLLCFTPPTPDLFVKQFPIAWRVTQLAAHGRSTLTATYVSTLGFSTPQVGGGRVVSAGNYTPIQTGEETRLTIDKKANPPIRSFSNPTKLSGEVDYVKAYNDTGEPVGFGLGFINNLGRPEESMDTVMVFDDVGDGLNVTAEFTPVLRAYVALNYQESDLLRADVQGVVPIWEANLVKLKSETTIIVSQDIASGGFVAKQLGSFRPMAANIISNPDYPRGLGMRVYKVALAFGSPGMVIRATNPILEHLREEGYEEGRLTYNKGHSDVLLELVLPGWASCDVAEQAMHAAIDSQYNLNERAYIKDHSGAITQNSDEGFSFWTDISPASEQWFVSEGIASVGIASEGMAKSEL